MIFLVVLAALTAYVAMPLYSPAAPVTAEDALRAAEASRQVLLRQLRDLEIERATNALDDATYHEERSRLESEADRLRAPRDD